METTIEKKPQLDDIAQGLKDATLKFKDGATNLKEAADIITNSNIPAKEIAIGAATGLLAGAIAYMFGNKQKPTRQHELPARKES